MKRYYAEREQILNSNIDLSIIKYYFLRIYKQFFYDNWFVEAKFVWALTDPELFLFRKLGSRNIWPFGKMITNYDEATLFSVIEFLYEYTYFNVPFETDYPDIKDGQKEYRNMVNDILRFYDGGYELSKNGEIQKLSPPGFETLIEEAVETNDPENIDSKIRYAISKFSRYSSSIGDKKEAVRTLAGLLEYLREDLKVNGKYLPTDDDNNLRNIMNNFNIRHQNRSQQSDYDKDIWYEWMFYTFLASIHVVLKLNDKKFDLKIQDIG